MSWVVPMPVECYTNKGKKKRQLFGFSNPKHQEIKNTTLTKKK